MIMAIGIGGLMSLFVIAAIKNAGQGDQATRTIEYAQDKMEQLMALPYSDTTTITAGSTNTTGAGGVGLLQGGGLDPANPVSGYSDFVTPTEVINPTKAGGVLYLREWQIADTVTHTAPYYTYKTISVRVTSFAAGSKGLVAPNTTLTAMKQGN